MPNPKPLMAESSGTGPATAAVQSALRTLDLEASGIAAITAALQSDLGGPFGDAPESARGLSAQSGADDLLADDAGAWRCARDRAPGRPRLYLDRFQRAASRRQTRRHAEIYPRPHARRRRGAAQAVGHTHVRGA